MLECSCHSSSSLGNADEKLIALPSNAFGPRTWRTESELGRGAYGNVVAIMHRPTRALLAVKTVALPRFEGEQVGDEDLDRARRYGEAAREEFFSIRKLEHPNILLGVSAVFGRWAKSASDEPGRAPRGPRCLFLVTEICLGGPLDAAADAMVRRDGGVALSCSGRGREVLHRWGTQMTRAIVFLHGQGYVHDDLKPSNLLLSGGFQGGHVKVADLGFSRELRSTELAMGGTPAYNPPARDARMWVSEGGEGGLPREVARRRKDVFAL